MLIAEELEGHICKPFEDYKIQDDILWVSDGDRWYPLKLDTQNTTPKRDTSQPDKANVSAIA